VEALGEDPPYRVIGWRENDGHASGPKHPVKLRKGVPWLGGMLDSVDHQGGVDGAVRERQWGVEVEPHRKKTASLRHSEKAEIMIARDLHVPRQSESLQNCTRTAPHVDHDGAAWQGGELALDHAHLAVIDPPEEHPVQRALVVT